jgi:hypothetical protein
MRAASAPADAPDDCMTAERVLGSDVSSYQGAVDWRQVCAAGVVFAFALVTRLRFVTSAGCTTRTLETPSVTATSTRDNKRHRWTIRVTGDLLQKEGCP